MRTLRDARRIVFWSNQTLEFSLLHLQPLTLFFSKSGGLRIGSGEADRPGGGDNGRATLGFQRLQRRPGQGGAGASMAVVAVGGGGREEGGRHGRGMVSPWSSTAVAAELRQALPCRSGAVGGGTASGGGRRYGEKNWVLDAGKTH